MPVLPGLIPPIRRSTKCPRCGMRHPRDASECPHCADLDDAALERYLAEQAERRQGGGRMGWLFLLIAAVLLALVVLVYLA